jgi:hypothetical protein
VKKKLKWIEKCAERYIAQAGVSKCFALKLARACADIQIDNDPWDDPEDAADEDMSYWAEEREA